MGDILSRNRAFFIPYAIILAAAGIVLFAFTKAEIQIFINQFHTKGADKFFMIYTYVGDAAVFVGVVVLLLFVKYRYALSAAIAGILTTAVTQSLKRLVFYEHYRPVKYFKDVYTGYYDLYIAQGNDPALYFSFPSGHTTAAFALFTSLALFSKNVIIKITALILAMAVAYSRMYLSWHFLEDVTVGSMIGLTFAFFSWYFVLKIKNPGFDGSLTKLFFNR